jgi:hypothetical protein
MATGYVDWLYYVLVYPLSEGPAVRGCTSWVLPNLVCLKGVRCDRRRILRNLSSAPRGFRKGASGWSDRKLAAGCLGRQITAGGELRPAPCRPFRNLPATRLRTPLSLRQPAPRGFRKEASGWPGRKLAGASGGRSRREMRGRGTVSHPFRNPTFGAARLRKGSWETGAQLAKGGSSATAPRRKGAA